MNNWIPVNPLLLSRRTYVMRHFQLNDNTIQATEYIIATGYSEFWCKAFVIVF